MHSSDPKSYGTNRPGGIPVVTLSTSPMGYMGDSLGVDHGMNWQGGNIGLGQEMMMQQPGYQTPGQAGGHSHLYAAGIVTGAIILLFLLGLAFPGSVQF